MEAHFDLIVIGGGAAGLAAATEGVRRGARTALVESGRLGGECTWTGCVPSKTLIAAAAAGVSFDDALARVHATVARVAATEDEAALASRGIEVIRGRARFTGPGEIDVGAGRQPAQHRARHFVIATGTRPWLPPVEGLDGVPHRTTDDIFEPRPAPASLAVMGGGPVGVELAQAFARLGVAVTLIEALPRLLALEEPAAAGIVTAALEADGVRVLTGSPVSRVERAGDAIRVHAGTGGPVDVAELLVAVGRRPELADLDLDRAGIRTTEQGYVEVDRFLRTANRRVYAAGDVTGLLPFTHAAHEMGFRAVANARGRRRRPFRPGAIPHVVFTDPEVARVGPVEADAPSGTRVAEVPMSGVDRAVAAGREEGFVKLLAAPRRVLGHAGGGRVAGATVVGPRAGELIHEAALAARTGMFAGRLVQTVHAYPTWSMAMREAAAQLFMEVDGRTARPAGHASEGFRDF